MSSLENDFLTLCRLMKLPEPVREHRFMLSRRYRFDAAWPDKKIAVELEGGIWTRGAHVRGKHFESDARKYNFATLAGWKVFRFTAGMIRSGEAVRTVMEAMELNHEALSGPPAKSKAGS